MQRSNYSSGRDWVVSGSKGGRGLLLDASMTSNCSKANIQETRDDGKEICFILAPASEKINGVVVPETISGSSTLQKDFDWERKDQGTMDRKATS
jgi:hypothetical protein